MSEQVTMMSPLVVLVVATIFSIIVIPIVWKFAPFLGFIDKPDARKVHQTPIPRVGGWGIAFGSVLPLVLFLEFDHFLISYLLGVVILFCLGAWDDAHESGHFFKFAGQITAASIIVFYGDVWIQQMPFFSFEQPPESIAKLFSVFAIVGMVNATNHSDGLDGLAGGESLLSLIVIAYLGYVVDGMITVFISCAVIGGILGFLRFNDYPAQIFMGDTGSGFLGFTLGVLAIYLTQHDHTALSPALVLLFLGLPIIDILGVLYLRAAGGLNWFRATRNHIHHRLLDLGFDHYETVVIIYSIQALFVISAIQLRYHSDVFIIAIYVAAALILYGTLTYAEKAGWIKHGGSVSSLSSTVRYFVNKKKSFISTSLALVGIFVPLYLILSSILTVDIPRDFSLIAATLAVLMIISLAIGKRRISTSTRSGIYICAIFTVYLFEKTEKISVIASLDNLVFILLTIAIGIVVRYAIDNKFQTSPIDYLIVFGVLVAAIFTGRYLDVQESGMLIVKSVIILYGCELLISRQTSRLSLLNISAVTSMSIIGIRGLV